MGKHRGTGMGPGRYLPFEMRQIGWEMHELASELAQLAKDGQKTQAEATLQEVTAACTACHDNYRITKYLHLLQADLRLLWYRITRARYRLP